MTAVRQILTHIDSDLNAYLLTQQNIHGRQKGRNLSFAAITRAALTGCSQANFQLGELDPASITAAVAEALACYAERRQAV
jgi:hypothetical protein